MVLAVDVGNTNIVLGGFEGDDLRFVSRMHTNKYRMMDEYAISFRSILEFNGYTSDRFDGAIISSVVPPLLPTLKIAAGRGFQAAGMPGADRLPRNQNRPGHPH